MKLMKRLMRKNNKGMSLVELICAVAILGLTTTALGGAMVMSARHYYRDSAEFEVQQDAQTATNLIGNLVTDAAEANWDTSTKKLTIKADGKTHVIYQDGDKLKYINTTDGTDGILAEGLPADAFSANTDNFKSNKSVNISLKVENGGKEFTSNYNATSRNGELSTAEFTEKVCSLGLENEVVIEPDQTYEFAVKLNGGMTATEVGNISVNRAGVPGIWDTDDAIKYTQIDDTNGKITLKAPINATGNFTFLVTTGEKEAGVPWASKTVQVKVRRVNSIHLNKASGDGYTAGSEYVFAASVLDGTNLTKGFGKAYDNDYKNPKHIKFEISGADYQLLEDKSLTDTPYIKFKLTSDIAPGSTFTVKAISYHAAIGQVEEAPGVYTKYNKTGTAYNTGAWALWTSPPSPSAPTPANPTPTFPAGIERGEDYNWGCVSDTDAFKAALENKYKVITTNGDGSTTETKPTVSYMWYVRFKEADNPDAEWTAYHRTVEEGNNRKIAGPQETRIMLPDKAYDIQFFVLYRDGNKVLWPHDKSLFNAGVGFGADGAGYVQGWDDADATATTFAQYGGENHLPAVQLVYFNKNDNSDDDIMNIPTGTTTTSVGSTSPIVFSIAGMNGKQPRLYFDTLHLAKEKSYNFTPVFWKKNGSGGWEKLEGTQVEVGTEKVSILNYQMSGGDDAYLVLKDFGASANTDTKITAVKGDYRMGLVLSGDYTEYKGNNATNRDVDVKSDKTWDLFNEDDESSTDGYFYFKITD